MNAYVDLAKEQFLSWEHRKPHLPKSINYPEEYDGSSDLRIVCTQLNLSSSKQKKLLLDWCEQLPKLRNVEHIWFYSRVPQAIFEAACNMPNLKSIFIKWSGNGITDFTSISKLHLLRRLYIGSCTQVESLEPLSALKNLQWLELHELKNVHDMTFISNLSNLIGLIFTGGMFGKQRVKSLQPLSLLSGLEYLDISSFYAESDGLLPLVSLKKLQYLNMPIYYEMHDYARLLAALPSCDHGIAAYREADEKCKKCATGELVLPMAKGRRKLCTSCDKDKIIALQKEFSDLLTAYLQKTV